MIGRVIGNYKIECKLGEGGMGAVYKGVDTMLDREVAIKALRPELASQTSVVERFRSEAVTLAKLHHPNIATLYSLFRQGEELYMVLEFVKGETLDSILQRRGALPADEVIPVFCQILDGINHAHELGIVHRDIKPANMMLTEKGTLKVLDFGIARLLGSNRMTRAGNVIGTLEYMAPEQVKGQETDARTDIYALGMMLYEVLTGRIPFETENEFELMRMQIEAAPTSPRSINPSIPQEVEEAIMRAIQKAPDARFQTAGDFREALLDAGYAAQGQMRRISGSHLAPSNTFSASQFISRPDETPEPTTPSTNVIKETRLGASESHAFEIKATRLGGGDTGSPIGLTLGDQSSASFFDKLNWIHYAGAGGGALVSLVMLVIVSIYAFSGENTTPQPSNTTQVKTSPTPSAAIQAREVTPDTAPTTATPKPMTVAQPVVAENPDPVYVEPIPIPTAASTERVKNDPPAPKPQPTPKKKKTGSSKKPQPSAECLLTGNC